MRMAIAGCVWWTILALVAVVFISNSAIAALLMPITVNQVYAYSKHDSAIPQNQWTRTLQGIEYVDVGGEQFLRIRSTTEDGTGDVDDVDDILMRSTETEVFVWDGRSVFLGFQIAPVGTTWNHPSYRGDDAGTDFHEIISIEPVSVPYGDFPMAWVDRVYFDPDDPGLPNTAYWYEYLVPGVGWVKQEDCSSSNPPAVLELVDVYFVCPWDCEAAPNGEVGIVDFLALLAGWGEQTACDFDGGGVGINDFLELLGNWGPCP